MFHDRCAVPQPPDAEQKSFGVVINELRGLFHVGMDTAVTKLSRLGFVHVRNDGGAARKGNNRTAWV